MEFYTNLQLYICISCLILGKSNCKIPKNVQWNKEFYTTGWNFTLALLVMLVTNIKSALSLSNTFQLFAHCTMHKFAVWSGGGWAFWASRHKLPVPYLKFGYKSHPRSLWVIFDPFKVNNSSVYTTLPPIHKRLRHYLVIFPNMRGGSSQFSKLFLKLSSDFWQAKFIITTGGNIW